MSRNRKRQDEDEEIESESEDQDADFTFVCTNPDGSPIFAMKVASSSSSSSSLSPASLRSPLRKLFFEENQPWLSSSSEVDELEGIPEGTYCQWSKKRAEAAQELKNKSNSMGSSRLWRLRDLKSRSNSDGKDEFVFLNPNSTTAGKKRSCFWGGG